MSVMIQLQFYPQNQIRFPRIIMPIIIAGFFLIFLCNVGSAETVMDGLGHLNYPLTSDWLPINHLAVKNPNISRNLQVANANAITGEIANYGNLSSLFAHFYFPPEDYVRYQGLDDTALYASSIAMSEDYAMVGSDGYNIWEGIVHIYKPLSVSEWTLDSYVYSPDGVNNNFGLRVAFDGNYMIVSANSYSCYLGIAYIYELFESAWTLKQRLKSPFLEGEGFGYAVALHNNTAAVSTEHNDVCVYELHAATETWERTMCMNGTGPISKFGNGLDIYQDYLVVGSPMYNESHGAVYVFKKLGYANWTLLQIIDSVEGFNTQFGYSLSIFNETIAVGAVGFRAETYASSGYDSEDNTGWVYIYELEKPLPNVTQEFALANSIQSPVGRMSYFGVSVALTQDKLMVGADGMPYGNTTGGAFVYYREAHDELSSKWTLNVSLPSPAGTNGHFGYALDVTDSYAAVGAYAYQDLRGSIYLIDWSVLDVLPTSAPTDVPTDGGNNNEGGAQSLSNSSLQGAKAQKLFLIILIVVIVSICLCILGICCYCCCCNPPVILKKKKKEEEESPYQVHSYIGYSEMDEYVPPPAPLPHWIPFWPQQTWSFYSQQAPPPPQEKTLDKKEKGDKTDMDEGTLRKMFPFKVYSFAGYHEQAGPEVDVQAIQEMEKTKMKEKDEASYAVDISMIPNNFASRKNMSSNHSSFMRNSSNHISLHTIRESDEDDQSESNSASYENMPMSKMSADEYDDDQRSLNSSGNGSYVSLAKQRYAEMQSRSLSFSKSQSKSGSSDDQISFVSLARRRHEQRLEQVGKYALEKSNDLMSVNSEEDSFVRMAKSRYLQFLTSYNKTENERERENEDLMNEQSYAFLQSTHVQPTDDDDDHSVSTMTASIYSESSRSTLRPQDPTLIITSDQSSSAAGVLDLQPVAPVNVTKGLVRTKTEQTLLPVRRQFEVVKVVKKSIAASNFEAAVDSVVREERNEPASVESAADEVEDEKEEGEVLVRSAVHTAVLSKAKVVLPLQQPASPKEMAVSHLKDTDSPYRHKSKEIIVESEQQQEIKTEVKQQQSRTSMLTKQKSTTSHFLDTKDQHQKFDVQKLQLKKMSTISIPGLEEIEEKEPAVTHVHVKNIETNATVTEQSNKIVEQEEKVTVTEVKTAALPPRAPLVLSRQKLALHSVETKGRQQQQDVGKIKLKSLGSFNFDDLAEVREVNSRPPSEHGSDNEAEVKVTIRESRQVIHVASSTDKIKQEVEEKRRKLAEEQERARSLAHSNAAEEEQRRVQERNRLKEESKLRAEEKARARFALYKQKAEDTAKLEQKEKQSLKAKLSLRTVEASFMDVDKAMKQEAVASSDAVAAPPAMRTIATTTMNRTVQQNVTNVTTVNEVKTVQRQGSSDMQTAITSRTFTTHRTVSSDDKQSSSEQQRSSSIDMLDEP